MMRLHGCIVACALAVMATGCDLLGGASSPPPPAKQEAPPVKVTENAPAAKPAASPSAAPAEAEGETAVDKALMWAQRCQAANEQVSHLQQENQALAQKNQTLQEQVNKARQELDQLNRELADANTMMVDVRKELDRWRASVLGFRQEIREAQQTQLEALAKIMKMLGGEMNVQPTTTSAPASRPADAGMARP